MAQTTTSEPVAATPDVTRRLKKDETEIWVTRPAPIGWRHDPFLGAAPRRPSLSDVSLLDQPPCRRVLRAMQRALDALPDSDRSIFIRVRFDGGTMPGSRSLFARSTPPPGTPGGDPDTAMVDAFALGFARNCRKADPR